LPHIKDYDTQVTTWNESTSLIFVAYDSMIPIVKSPHSSLRRVNCNFDSKQLSTSDLFNDQ